MSTAVIWSKSKPDVVFQYGWRLGEFNGMSSQSHLPHSRVLPPGEFSIVVPKLRVTLQGAATWWIHCHDSRATCHIAGCSHHDEIIRPNVVIVLHCSCKNYIRHIENRVAIFYFFCFLMQFGLWRTAAFVSSPIHLFYKPNYVWESWLKTNCTLERDIVFSVSLYSTLFLLRDAMYKCGLCCRVVSVRLSVPPWLFVTFVYCIKTNKRILERFLL